MIEPDRDPTGRRPRRLRIDGVGFQMKGDAGDPQLNFTDIERRRLAVSEARRAHELHHLEAERARYGLPVRGRPLSEQIA